MASDGYIEVFAISVRDVDDEVWAIIFTRATVGDALRTLGPWASDRETAFSWYDAARVSQQIRRIVA